MTMFYGSNFIFLQNLLAIENHSRYNKSIEIDKNSQFGGGGFAKGRI